MNTCSKKLLICLAVAGLLLPVAGQAQDNPDWSGELVWPREYSNEAGAKLVMYQPQVTNWEEAKHLEARLAIAFSAPGAETPSLGTFEVEAATQVDLETRLVKLTEITWSKCETRNSYSRRKSPGAGCEVCGSSSLLRRRVKNSVADSPSLSRKL